MNGEIKAILFDFDDTLLNSKKAEVNALSEFRKLYKEIQVLSEEDLRVKWKEVTKKAYDKYLNKEITFQKLRVERMKELFEICNTIISDEQAAEIYHDYQKHYENNWTLFDDAAELIDYCKDKYTLGIITNGDSNQQRKKIEKTGLDKIISNIFISGEVGHAKPEKEIFEVACKTMGVKPENCLMIGDKIEVDVQGGLNAGMKAVWMNRRNEKSDYKYQVTELTELKDLLNKI